MNTNGKGASHAQDGSLLFNVQAILLHVKITEMYRNMKYAQ